MSYKASSSQCERYNKGYLTSKKIFDLAKEKAEFEKTYKIALRHEILKLKDEKYPATLILSWLRDKRG